MDELVIKLVPTSQGWLSYQFCILSLDHLKSSISLLALLSHANESISKDNKVILVNSFIIVSFFFTIYLKTLNKSIIIEVYVRKFNLEEQKF